LLCKNRLLNLGVIFACDKTNRIFLYYFVVYLKFVILTVVELDCEAPSIRGRAVVVAAAAAAAAAALEVAAVGGLEVAAVAGLVLVRDQFISL